MMTTAGKSGDTSNPLPTAIYGACLFVLAGCASTPTPVTPPEQVVIIKPNPEIIPVEPELPTAITQGIEPEEVILSQQIDNESPWELAFRADQAPTDVATELRLAAIDGFLDIQDFTSAETQANYLLDVYLNLAQQTKFGLQRGRIAQGLGQYQIAAQYLEPLKNSPDLDFSDQALVLQTLSEAQLALDRRVDALLSLLNRDLLLINDQQMSNQIRIINLLKTLTSLEQSLLKQIATNRGFQGNLIDGWLAFTQIAYLPESEQPTSLFAWHSTFPNHPAQDQLLGSKMSIPLDQFNHIALLLPLTSPFGSAAKAYYDGFIDAYNQDNSVFKPAISLHDIGEDPGLASFYYRSAMNEGADFVVGPLGRDAVNTLLSNQPPQLPTLVLADVDQINSAPNLYGISLSPELEASQVAERAYADGHRQAAIFRSVTPWGQRAADAFTESWLSLGGTIVSNKSFPDTIEDYSRIIQKLLEVNKSVARHRVLSAQLGLNIKFSPRRRDDVDLLFLAANARQARLLVPQLRFFQAHNLPIYATSNIFSGDVSPAVDADLDKLIFGDMRWMLDIRYETPGDNLAEEAMQNLIARELQQLDSTSSDDPTTESTPPEDQTAEIDTATESEPLEESEPKPELVAKSPYSFTPLDRLYALGLESYHLIPRLSVLRKDGWQRYNGQAFQASIRADGNVRRHMEWATFEKGKISLLDQMGNEDAL